MLLQSSPPTFPAEPVEPGKTWTAKPSKISHAGLGALMVDQIYTFQGPDPRTPNCCRRHRGESDSRTG